MVLDGNSCDGFPRDVNFRRKTIGQINGKTWISICLLTKTSCQVFKMTSTTMSDQTTILHSKIISTN